MARLNLRIIFAVLLAIAVTACSKSPEPSSSGANATQAPSSTNPALPPVDLKGPIVGLAMASSIDDKGRPVNPRFTFAPDERQLTVIVSVGKVTGSMLDMVWYKTSDDGEEKLFEYHVDVHSYDRAYSIGKNSRVLASGNYKITAALEGYKREVAFDVASPKGQPPLTSHSEAAQGTPPVPGGSGTVPQPMAKSAAAASGASQEKPLDLSKCEMTPESFGDNVPPAVFVMAATFCPREGVLYFAGPAKVDATIEGPARPIADDAAVFRIDPCSLSGASDLPETKILVTATGQIGDQRPVKKLEITLGKDTLSPRLDVHSKPPKGSKVKAGDKIEIKVNATEARSGGPWQTGVMSVQLTAQPGGSVGDGWTNPSKRALRCEAKTWSHEYLATYTVPSNPPDTIEICALTLDYATNVSNQENSKCAKFFTGDAWKGTIKVKAVGNAYDEEGELALAFTVSKDGSVKGSAHFRRTANRPHFWSVNSCTFTRKYSSDEFDVPITGRREGDRFVLNIDPLAVMGTQTHSGKCPDLPRSTGSLEGTLMGPLAGFAVHPIAVEAKDGVINHFMHETFNDIATDATIELHRAPEK